MQLGVAHALVDGVLVPGDVRVEDGKVAAVGLAGAGSGIAAAGFVLTAILLVLVGPGGSLAVPAATSLLLDSVPAERAGTASAMFNTFRQVGGAIGIAVFGALVSDPGRFVAGMQLSLVIAAVLLLGTALASTRVRATHEPQASAAHG